MLHAVLIGLNVRPAAGAALAQKSASTSLGKQNAGEDGGADPRSQASGAPTPTPGGRGRSPSPRKMALRGPLTSLRLASRTVRSVSGRP